MTEKEYIQTRQLSMILDAGDILSNLQYTDHETIIPEKEYKQVMRKLNQWKEKLFEVCVTTPEIKPKK